MSEPAVTVLPCGLRLLARDAPLLVEGRRRALLDGLADGAWRPQPRWDADPGHRKEVRWMLAYGLAEGRGRSARREWRITPLGLAVLGRDPGPTPA